MKLNNFQDNSTLKKAKRRKFELYALTDILSDETRKSKKIKKRDYLENGNIPIIDQGASFIGGYSNLEEGYFDEAPFIVFGDHTRILKYIEEPSFIGADGVKILTGKLQNKINLKYIYYFLKSVDIPNTGYSRHFKYLKEVIIPIPSLKIQDEIVFILNKMSNLIDKRKQQIISLTSLKKSIFLKMFGDPTINPYQYEVKSLKDFYFEGKTAVKCGPFGSALKKDEYVNAGVPVWNMSNITNNYEFVNEIYLAVTPEKADALKGYNVKNGDIIISRAGTVGKMAVVNSDAETTIISTNLIRLRLKEKLLPEYFVMLMQIFGNRVCRLRTGNDGAFTHMNTKVLDSIEFPYPPLDKQQEFLTTLKEINKQKEKLEMGLGQFENLYNTLVQKAFNGELFDS